MMGNLDTEKNETEIFVYEKQENTMKGQNRFKNTFLTYNCISILKEEGEYIK